MKTSSWELLLGFLIGSGIATWVILLIEALS